MDALSILDSAEQLDWEYDAEADVLYISIGGPRPSVTVDLGEGILARYDDDQKELTGLTLMNVRARLLQGLATQEPS